MSLIQQELQDLKIQLESEGKHKHVAGETKIIRKIDFLKEQFRELLVESRQRRAAEQENAMILSEDDPVNYCSVKCFPLIRLSLVTTYAERPQWLPFRDLLKLHPYKVILTYSDCCLSH